uniref:Uncharacterized protein n=1 Tax=Sinocyclocheilus anshuiensis TaxID=1608454 RepID=A0A671PUE6_9TELE
MKKSISFIFSPKKIFICVSKLHKCKYMKYEMTSNRKNYAYQISSSSHSMSFLASCSSASRLSWMHNLCMISSHCPVLQRKDFQSFH